MQSSHRSGEAATVGLTYYIRTVRTIPVAEFEHSRTWRVQCPDDRHPRDWRKDDVELFVAAVCLCVSDKDTNDQFPERVLDTVAYWSITRIDDGQYSLAVSNDGREWNTQEPLPLAAAVRAFDSESTEGAGGDLQLEPTIMDRARKLDVRPVKR